MSVFHRFLHIWIDSAFLPLAQRKLPPYVAATPKDSPFHPGRGRRGGGRGRGWVADLPCCALHPPRAARYGPIHEAMGGHGSAIPPSASAPPTLAQAQRAEWRFRAQGCGEGQRAEGRERRKRAEEESGTTARRGGGGGRGCSRGSCLGRCRRTGGGCSRGAQPRR